MSFLSSLSLLCTAFLAYTGPLILISDQFLHQNPLSSTYFITFLLQVFLNVYWISLLFYSRKSIGLLRLARFLCHIVEILDCEHTELLSVSFCELLLILLHWSFNFLLNWKYLKTETSVLKHCSLSRLSLLYVEQLPISGYSEVHPALQSSHHLSSEHLLLWMCLSMTIYTRQFNT